MMLFFCFFGGGVPLPIYLLASFSQGQIMLHPEFHCPRSSGSALKVPGGGMVWWWETPIIIITLHLVEVS